MSTETPELDTPKPSQIDTEPPKEEDAPGTPAGDNVDALGDHLEELEWPGAKGDGRMDLHYFAIVGLPETIEDEQDPTLRMILALIAEVQNLRARVVETEAGVKYLGLDAHLKKSGKSGARGPRPRRVGP